ncbi:DNA-binding response regulator [Actinomycetes bacterium]|nr:DNA-binding response regulator [Actinomycetes bacterium]
MAARILTVDDDHQIRNVVKSILEVEGWLVEQADTGEQAVKVFSEKIPDIVLIDVALPDMNGFDLCRTLRQNSDVPIMIVTARTDIQDVVTGLESGADDYLTKPFAPQELSARVRALLRRARQASPSHQKMIFGNLEIIPDEGKVLLNDKEVPVTKTEFQLLCELGQDRGGVLSREVLLDNVWGLGYFGDMRLVDVHVRRLRMKIEDEPSNPKHLVTVRGLGYRLQQ